MSHSERQPPLPAERGRSRRFAGFCVLTVVFSLATLATDFLLRSLPPPRVVKLQFTVAPWHESRREPLLCTGANGTADFLYVTYLADDTVAFGYDSWGAGGPTSPPVKVRAGEPLLLEIVMPSFASLTSGHPSGTLAIRIAGRLDWHAPVSSHACTARQVQWAVNRIGGTSCSDALSGTLERPNGHRVSGIGVACYYDFVERFGFWLTRAWPAVVGYAACSAALGWLLAFIVGLEPFVRRIRLRSETSERWVADAAAHPRRHVEDTYEASAWLHRLPTKAFLIGFGVGFLACVGAGFVASRQVLFHHFERFFQPIQPQTYFYPTAGELVSYVEGTVPHDKILVLVGGASYFRGTGQNPDEVWTLELQRLLGERYAVVNFAIDQAGPPAFAAVAYQILAREYPHMVYVTTGGPFSEDPLDGGDVYGYIYWDAYYKGRLGADPVWNERVKHEIAREMCTPEGGELHLGKRFDAFTYASDLWHWIGYRWVFTVWSDSYPLHPFRARGKYVEDIDPNMAEHQRHAREDPDYYNLMVQRAADAGQTGYVKDAHGQWVVDPSTPPSIAEHYNAMLPPEVRHHTLVVLLHGNPYFMRTMTPAARQRVSDMITLSQRVVEKLGYSAVQAGGNFNPDDYVDAGHFMASGGRKIAHLVAAKITAMKP